MNKLLLHCTLLLLGLSNAGLTHARAFQSHESIREAARDFLIGRLQDAAVQNAEVEVGRLDPRLRLQACSQALETFPTGRAKPVGAVTVGVRCDAPRPWTLYVTGRVRAYGDVVVAARPLGRGTVLGTDDLDVVRKELSTLAQGYLDQPRQAVGKVLKRSVNNGAVVSPNQIAEPELVKRGDKVILAAEAGGIEVRMTGTALESGASGDVVRVRNQSSERIVHGEVIGAGVVRVRL